MLDPLEPIFGMPTRQLFAQPELTVSHGALERFPAFMFKGAMSSVDALCRDYQGSIEVAKGQQREGVQFGVNGAHPAALLQVGLTVYFQDLKRLLAGSPAWLSNVEASLGLPECASIMAFVNAPGSGLSVHHDRHDQLFFQISGEKVFHYAPNGYVKHPDLQFSPANAALPDFGQRYREGFPLNCDEVLAKPFTTLELKPGSAFFMPAGTWHTTADQRGQALSLVVAVRAPSRLDLLLNLLSYYVGQAPEWRERAYGAWAQDAATAARAEAPWAPLLADLSQRLAQLPASAASQAWSSHGFTLGTQTTYPRARFERFIRLPNSSLEFADDSSTGKLRCTVLSGPNHRPQARTVLAIEHEAREVVDWVLASHSAFTTEQLCAAFPDFARDDVEQLLSWLGHAALIRPLPAPEWNR